MPKLGLGLLLARSMGASSAVNSSNVINFTLSNYGLYSPNFSFNSISNYTDYVDPNISYSLPLSSPVIGKLNVAYVSSVSQVFIRKLTSRNFWYPNDYGGYSSPTYADYFYLQKSGSTYTADFYRRELSGTDYKGNEYYDFFYETTWTLSWNGTAWQLFGKANVGSTAGVLKTYTGGSASALPPSLSESDLDLGYNVNYTNSLSDSNMNGDSNQLYFTTQSSNNVYKTKTITATLTQTGKLGLIFNFSLPSVYTTGSPVVSSSFSNSYTSLFSPLFNFLSSRITAFTSPISSDIYLPKDAVSSTSISLTTNGDLTNLTSQALSSLSQTSTTLTNSNFSAVTYSISADLTENTTSSNRAISISGTKTYDNTSFTAISNAYQIGTTAPSPIISISSNNTTPRNFYLTHVGSTLSTRTQGENEGLALWDSTKKLWAIPKMGQYIRYYGGKYEFINISGTTIETSSSQPWLANTDACSPTVMPWNARWQQNIDVSKHYFDAMQKPTTLNIDTTFRFPLSGYNASSFKIKSSQSNIGGYIISNFKLGQYKKLAFMGIYAKSPQSGYPDSGVRMYYSYAENKWFLVIYESVSNKGSSSGNAYTYSAPYSTSFPITFTYVSRANTSSSTIATTLQVSKDTATAFDDVYTLADATYPITIPVDTAFSSIW
jgi:hypothetical protein